jgi:hypothetical protein
MDIPSKIDVFVRTTSAELLDPLRKAMLDVTLARWALEPVTVKLICDIPIRDGRIWAEDNAQSDPYIFTDSDCLIVGKDWVKRAVEIMLAYPKFKIVSTLSLIEGENLATPVRRFWAGTTVEIHQTIYSMHMVGQPMLIRKGICTNLPDMDLNSECGVLHKLVLDQGYEEGLFHPDLKIRHNHLGHGFSGSPCHFWGY